VPETIKRWADLAFATYPGAVFRRFFALQLLDKSFGLAAQVFIALLPLLIGIVSLVMHSNTQVIGEGMTNRQIGESMHLAEKTVKNYVSSLLAKLGMERRTQAAAFAARLSVEDEHRH